MEFPKCNVMGKSELHFIGSQVLKFSLSRPYSKQRIFSENTVKMNNLEIIFTGQVQRLTPIIPALWEAKAGGSPEVKS